MDSIDVPAEPDTNPAQTWMDSLGYEEQGAVGAAKRLAVDWTPWMGDWFVSSSPRNSNTHAEGYWDHWVDLAIKILRDPLTELVRPEAHAVAANLPDPLNLYSDVARELTADELMARFRRTT